MTTRSVFVAGAGLMGHGIAQVHAATLAHLEMAERKER